MAKDNFEDRVIKKLLDHDKKFDVIDKRFDEIKDNFNQRFNEMTGVLDNILVTVQRIDQERMFMFELYGTKLVI